MSRQPPERRYPPFYEKAVPVALVLVAVALVALLAVAVGVALGYLPAAP